MELADELELMCYEKGLSYRKLADICRLNQHTMRNALIKNEYEYLMGRIDVLANALGADANELRMKYPYPPEDEATCFGTHRYDRILEAICEGVPDSRIMAKWPDMTGDVLMVYHKIADGTLSNFSKRGGSYDDRNKNTVLEESGAIAFGTVSLHWMSDDIGDDDEI